jgi:hypothetical protein
MWVCVQLAYIFNMYVLVADISIGRVAVALARGSRTDSRSIDLRGRRRSHRGERMRLVRPGRGCTLAREWRTRTLVHIRNCPATARTRPGSTASRRLYMDNPMRLCTFHTRRSPCHRNSWSPHNPSPPCSNPVCKIISIK